MPKIDMGTFTCVECGYSKATLGGCMLCENLVVTPNHDRQARETSYVWLWDCKDHMYLSNPCIHPVRETPFSSVFTERMKRISKKKGSPLALLIQEGSTGTPLLTIERARDLQRALQVFIDQGEALDANMRRLDDG